MREKYACTNTGKPQALHLRCADHTEKEWQDWPSFASRDFLKQHLIFQRNWSPIQHLLCCQSHSPRNDRKYFRLPGASDRMSPKESQFSSYTGFSFSTISSLPRGSKTHKVKKKKQQPHHASKVHSTQPSFIFSWCFLLSSTYLERQSAADFDP